MILIHPPVSKPCEPPVGIAKLQSVLTHHGINSTVLDSNIEGLLHLLVSPQTSSDTWTRRASRSLPNHLRLLRSWDGYKNLDRYTRAVVDLNRLLDVAAFPYNVRLSLADYEHRDLLPVRSSDLIRASERPEENPFYPYFRDRIPGLLESKKPSIIGFSLNYLSQALSTFGMIGFLRQRYPGLTLVLGGGLVTSWMRKPGWQNRFSGVVDHVVDGPGEIPLLSIHGVKAPPEDVSFPPDYDSFPLGSYFAPGILLPYSASSGCYWNQCSSCPERAEGNAHLPIPIGRIVRDLHALREKRGPSLLHLTDNAISPALLKALSENPPGMPWYGFVRITRHLTDLDFCRALKRSGCVMLKLGLESGDQGVLDQMNKGFSLEEASKAIKSLKEAGISTYVYLLFGTPSEGLAEARQTLKFTAKHAGGIDFLNLALFNLPIGCQGELEVKTRQFYQGDLSLYTDFIHPKGWSRKRVRQFLEKEFKRHPAISPILKRDAPTFTSNHAPLLAMAPRYTPLRQAP